MTVWLAFFGPALVLIAADHLIQHIKRHHPTQPKEH